jgi:multiple sugar transport system substrate-binding protein
MTGSVLKGITWDHPRGLDPLIAASKVYERRTGTVITWEKQSLKDFGDFPVELLAEEYDLLIFDHPHVGEIAASGSLVPLDAFIDPGTLDSLRQESAGRSFESYHYGGHQWGLPVDAAFQSSSYRPDLLQAGLPQRWEEVFRLNDEVRPQRRYLGMALSPADSACSLVTMLVCREEGRSDKVLFNEKDIIKALQILKKIKREFHPLSLEWNPIALYDHMSGTDEVVYCPLAFNYTNYSRKDFSRSGLRFADPPGKCSILGGAGIGISKKCRQVEKAAEFASWLCGEDCQRNIYVVNQGQPGNILAWKDREANQLTQNFFNSTRTTLEAAAIRPRFPGWPAFQELTGNLLHAFLTGKYTIETIAKKIRSEYLATENFNQALE